MHVPHSVGVAREDTEEGYTCRRRGRGSSEKQMDVWPGAGKRWGKGKGRRERSNRALDPVQSTGQGRRRGATGRPARCRRRGRGSRERSNRAPGPVQAGDGAGAGQEERSNRAHRPVQVTG